MLSISLLSSACLTGLLLTRFRCGCHGLHVDSGRWVGLDRKDRLFQVCKSAQNIEDEHHFVSL